MSEPNAELRSELLNDPLGLGYAQWLPDSPGKVAELLNATTRMIVRRGMGDVTTRGAAARFPSISGLPGPLAFEAAMLALDAFSSANLNSADTVTQLMARAVKRQTDAFQLLGLDFADPALRATLDQLGVLGVLTQAQVDGFKNLGVYPGSRAEELGLPPVTELAVMAALED